MGAPVLIQLASLESIKTMLRIGVTEPDTSEDDRLELLLDEVSREMEQRMKRHAASAARVETYKLRAGESLISLRAAPVTSITSVIVSLSRDFSSEEAETLVVNVDYDFDLDEGTIAIPGLIDDKTYVRVSYVGGMATDTATFELNWPDIAGKCRRQVIHAFQRITTPGGNVQVGQGPAGGATQFTGKYDWLPDVLATCDAHARTTF